MKKEKYNLLDFKDFLFSKDEAVKEMGWWMVLNSINLKHGTLDDLIEIQQQVRSKDYSMLYAPHKHPYKRVLQKLNKNIQRYSSKQVENAKYRYFKNKSESVITESNNECK